MPSRIGHGVLISITVIALLFGSVITSYAETTTYNYDELNRVIQVIYEDGRGVTYTYDASGNRITLTQSVDTVPPTGTIIINSGDAVTYNSSVTLALTCSDNVGCSHMQFSNDNVTYSTPEAYGTTKSWTLSPGYGTKTVYAKFKDAAGNWSTAYGDTIDLIMDSYAKSLLHMNGTDGSTTFTDSAAGGTHTWTAHGNAQIDTAQSKFGGASGLFDGTGDYIDTPDSADWTFGNGNFTIDFWIRAAITQVQNYGTPLGTGTNLSDANLAFTFQIPKSGGSVGKLQFVWWNGSGTPSVVSTTTITDANWHHIAVVRNGTSLKLYVDGIEEASYTLSAGFSFYNGTKKLAIGRRGEDATGTTAYTGHMDEVRISKGIARWTSNFTPPSDQYYP